MNIAALLCLWGAAAPVAAETWGDMSLATVNELRKRNGAGPVQIDSRLARAAAVHASDMHKRGFFSHTGSDGSSVAERARRQGFGFCLIAENLAKGPKSDAEVLKGWMNSSGHRRNLLNRQATHYALVMGPDHLWVMVLGRPGC